MKLKVLTLNCWGIFVPHACKLLNERINAIGEYLPSLDCDIISLQEIWKKENYYYLKARLADTYPYAHYFYSGSYGSGVCVFSKHEIISAHKHVYSLNGYAHRIFQSDWYGGKLVGLVVMRYNDLVINFYATHMHAQYNEDDTHHDAYTHHRTLQALEMSRYISMTSSDCDLVIAVGDFNHRPDQLGYKVLTVMGGLEDAWTENTATCDRPDNVFCTPSKKFPLGVKLDYILYRCNKDIDARVLESGLEMRKVPGDSYNFSDHEGVVATFEVDRADKEKEATKEKPVADLDITGRVADALTRGIASVRVSQRFYLVLSLIASLLLFLLTSVRNAGAGRSGYADSYDACLVVREATLFFSEAASVLFLGFAFWHAFVVLNRERYALVEAINELGFVRNVGGGPE